MHIRASQSADRGPRKALGKDLEGPGGCFYAQDCPFQSILVGQAKRRSEYGNSGSWLELLSYLLHATFSFRPIKGNLGLILLELQLVAAVWDPRVTFI